MASIPVLLLLLLTLLTAERSTSSTSTIHLGSSLSPNGKHTSWASSSRRFAFGFYPKGNGFAVGIWLVSSPENTVVWTADRDSPPLSSNSSLNLTKHGLLLRTGEDHRSLIPYPDDDEIYAVASASMHDSGNFVLCNASSFAIWQSFDYPADTILGGQNFTSENDDLVSSMSKLDHSSGRFYLSMQSDGNLVAYPLNSSGKSGDAYWAYIGAKKLSLNVEGFLCSDGDAVPCLYHKPKNKSQYTSSIYRATLDVDGNFRLYEHRFEANSTRSHASALWQALHFECDIKGVCGVNSYCSSMSGNAVCYCYPGFVPSNISDNVSPACTQTNIKDDCESSENPMVLYRVIQWDNISWGGDDDTPYSVTSGKKEACVKSCQEDCDCGGALYSSGHCNKYSLPLVYGRIMSQNASRVALLKVPSGKVIRPNPTSNTTNMPTVVVDNKTSLILTLALTLGFISLFCLVFAVSIFYIYRRQVYKYTTLSTNEDLGFTDECSLRSFSYDELVKSTGGFTEEIGRGSFGAVYKGTMGDNSNRRIAVKRLERVVDEGEREFRAEIAAIARTHHRNLVKLVGFCIEGSKKLLVYEYVSNGSLANLLFNDKIQGMSWKERIKIALDVARGVLYLHEECEVRIIHCNINPRNILMDEAWIAKISDFGLARLLKPDYSRTKKGDDGTSRYLAPEWHKDASVSVKVDIYSFGMVLLETICRRSSIEMNVSLADQEILLSRWVYQCFAARQLNMLVTHDEEDVDRKIMERMVKVGLWCVQDNSSLRPSMKNVILMLEGLKDIPIPPSPTRLVE